MKPRIFKVDPENIDAGLLRQAAEAIRAGGLVAFPTETVYGLGANALDAEAVTGIFEAKQRPLDDPLIVHISDRKDLHGLSRDIPPEAEKLVDRFWPGPLTVVVKKTEKVPDLVTTGLETVAVRMPSCAIAGKLIEEAGVPVAAPSANLFGRPSPTKAQHVIEDLNGRIDVVLDGGPTSIGVESTVVEFVEGRVIVLRPGGIDLESLRSVTGNVHIYTGEEESERSPGKYPQHYSPKAKVLIAEEGEGQLADARSLADKMVQEGKKTGVMAREEHAADLSGYDVKVLGPGNDGKACALNLFHVLREFDSGGKEVIVAEAVPEKGLGLAVMNRLRKAAGPSPA